MTANCDRIGTLVMRVQNDFLDTPGLALTLPRARRRFHLDVTTCEAVLSALAEAHVLSRTRDGAYVRPLPRHTAHAA